MMQYQRQPFLTLTASKILFGCGLALILWGIISLDIFLYFRLGVISMYSGLGLQLYVDWKNGNKAKLKGIGFHLLIGLATIGLLTIITTFAKSS